jgi:hypothetical protein
MDQLFKAAAKTGFPQVVFARLVTISISKIELALLFRYIDVEGVQSAQYVGWQHHS